MLLVSKGLKNEFRTPKINNWVLNYAFETGIFEDHTNEEVEGKIRKLNNGMSQKYSDHIINTYMTMASLCHSIPNQNDFFEIHPQPLFPRFVETF